MVEQGAFPLLDLLLNEAQACKNVSDAKERRRTKTKGSTATRDKSKRKASPSKRKKSKKFVDEAREAKDVMFMCMGTLSNIALEERCRKRMINENMARTLISLARRPTNGSLVRSACATAIRSLASTSKSALQVTSIGGLDALVDMASENDDAIRRECYLALCTIMSCNFDDMIRSVTILREIDPDGDGIVSQEESRKMSELQKKSSMVEQDLIVDQEDIEDTEDTEDSNKDSQPGKSKATGERPDLTSTAEYNPVLRLEKNENQGQTKDHVHTVVAAVVPLGPVSSPLDVVREGVRALMDLHDARIKQIQKTKLDIHDKYQVMDRKDELITTSLTLASTLYNISCSVSGREMLLTKEKGGSRGTKYRVLDMLLKFSQGGGGGGNLSQYDMPFQNNSIVKKENEKKDQKEESDKETATKQAKKTMHKKQQQPKQHPGMIMLRRCAMSAIYQLTLCSEGIRLMIESGRILRGK